MTAVTTLPIVTYDRRTRQWTVQNGRLLGTFPAGPEGKVRAEWAAIAYASPLIHDAAQALAGELVHVQGAAARVLRAAWIVLKGDVQGATVRSQANPTRWYRVEERSLIGLHCECQDYQDGRESRFYPDRNDGAPTANGQTWCKHVLVLAILERAAELEKIGNSEVAARKLDDRAATHAARQARKAASCPTCKGRGQYTGVNTWTGHVGPMKCHCQIEW